MSFLGTIRRQWKNLRDALRFSHHACRTVERVKAELDASNASGALKDAATALVDQAHALCAAIEAYKEALDD